MVAVDFGSATVDICRDGCKGIWFEPLELRPVEAERDAINAALNEALDHPRVKDQGRGRLTCPKCEVPMHTHKFKSAREVDVDECYVCGGLFLDSGELKAIREGALSEEESRAYYARLVSELPVYREAERELTRKKLDAEAASVRAQALSFLTNIYNFDR